MKIDVPVRTYSSSRALKARIAAAYGLLLFWGFTFFALSWLYVDVRCACGWGQGGRWGARGLNLGGWWTSGSEEVI